MARSSEKPRSRNQDELQLRAVAEFKARQQAEAVASATEAEIIELHPSEEPETVPAEKAQQPNKKENSGKNRIPEELKEIYGSSVPREVLETYTKLRKEGTKRSYLARLRVEKAEKTHGREAFESVVSETMDRLKDVDTSGMRTEYSNTKPLGWMQKDMNALKGGAEFAADAVAESRADFVVPMPYIGGTPFDSEPSEVDEKSPSDFSPSEPAPEIVPTDVPVESTEAPLALDSADIPGYIKESLAAGETPAGWKSMLRELVGKFGEGVSERFTNSKNYLDERAKELDAKAEMSGLEKWTRNIGEKYNKLSTIHKLGIGVTLGVGTAVGAAFSLPLALTGVAGLVLQRAAGAAGMFVSIEKKLQEKKVGESYQWMAVKERAALDALLYTAVMGTAISKSLEVARDYELVEKTREWLGSMLGHSATAPNASDVKAETYATEPVQELPKSVRGFQVQAMEIDTLMAGRGFHAEVREIDNAILKAQEAPIAAAELHEPTVIPTAPGLPIENAPTQPETIIASEPAQPEVSSSIPEELPPPPPSEIPTPSPEVTAPATPEIL